KRTHAVAEENVGFARVRILRDGRQRNHVFDKLNKTAGAEIAKTSRRLCRQSMTAVIVSIYHKPCFNQFPCQFCIAPNVLAQSVGDLHNSANMLMIAPFPARNAKTIRTFKSESPRSFIQASVHLGSQKRQSCSVRVTFHVLRIWFGSAAG